MRASARVAAAASRGSARPLTTTDPAAALAPPWPAVGALALDQLMAWGALYYTFSVVHGAMARDLRVSSGLVAGGFSLALLVAGLAARKVGRDLDRLGARRLLLLGAMAGGCALGALALARGPVTLLLGFTVLGVAQALALYEPALGAVVRWVPAPAPRARALLLVTCVGGLASLVFLPLTTTLQARWGWRGALGLLALVPAGLLLPLRWWTLPRDGVAPVPRALPRSTRTSLAARLLACGFALHALVSTGVSVFLVRHLIAAGRPAGAAAALAGLAGAAQLPGRLLLAPLQVALPSGLRLPLLLSVQAGALAMLARGGGALATGAVLLFGAVAGMMTLERAVVTVEWFGAADFGARSGELASVVLLARAAAPATLALAHGQLGAVGSYRMLAVVLLAGAAIMVLAARSRRAVSAR